MFPPVGVTSVRTAKSPNKVNDNAVLGQTGVRSTSKGMLNGKVSMPTLNITFLRGAVLKFNSLTWHGSMIKIKL